MIFWSWALHLFQNTLALSFDITGVAVAPELAKKLFLLSLTSTILSCWYEAQKMVVAAATDERRPIANLVSRKIDFSLLGIWRMCEIRCEMYTTRFFWIMWTIFAFDFRMIPPFCGTFCRMTSYSWFHRKLHDRWGRWFVELVIGFLYSSVSSIELWDSSLHSRGFLQ